MTNGQCAVGGLPKTLVRRAYSKTIEIELLDKVVTVLEDTDSGLENHRACKLASTIYWTFTERSKVSDF